MKSVKSLLALLLCLMMLVSLFAGCQKNEADDAPVSDTATEEKKEETKKEEPKKEEPKKEEPKKEEAKAEEKKEEAAPSNESEHVELSFVWTNWNNKSAEDDDVFAWMEERFNCDFEWINLASDIRTEKLGVMWASGDKFTASFGLNGTGNASCLQVQYDNDWIWALDDFLDSCPIIAAETADECWAYTRMSDGKIYGIPEQGCEVKTGLWVRQDWLGKVGLDLPKTIDDLEVVMDAFHNGDPDGDGVADTYGAVALFANFSSYDHYILSAFLPYGDSWQPISDSDNTLYPKFMHPDYKGYLSTLADWKQKGYIHPNQTMMNYDTSIAAFVQGEAGMFFTWYGEGDSGVGNLLAASPDADPIMISSPSGANGQGGSMQQNLYGGSIVFNKKASEEEVKRYLEILDYYCTAEGNAVRNYGIPGVQWEDNGDTVKVPDGKEKVYSSYCRLPGGLYCREWRPLEGGLECINKATIDCYTGKLAYVKSYDYMFPYQWAGTESENKISDLSKLISTYVEGIVGGNMAIDDLDRGIEEWLAAGGEKYIEEYNAQYNDLKAIYG